MRQEGPGPVRPGPPSRRLVACVRFLPGAPLFNSRRHRHSVCLVAGSCRFPRWLSEHRTGCFARRYLGAGASFLGNTCRQPTRAQCWPQIPRRNYDALRSPNRGWAKCTDGFITGLTTARYARMSTTRLGSCGNLAVHQSSSTVVRRPLRPAWACRGLFPTQSGSAAQSPPVPRGNCRRCPKAMTRSSRISICPGRRLTISWTTASGTGTPAARPAVPRSRHTRTSTPRSPQTSGAR